MGVGLGQEYEKCYKIIGNFFQDGCSDLSIYLVYSKTCVTQPPLKLTFVVDVERWLSYNSTCHVILLAKLYDMYLYKTDNFFNINHYFKSSQWLSYTGFTVFGQTVNTRIRCHKKRCVITVYTT